MEQLEVLRFIIGALEDLDIRYMVVGAFASGSYAEPRFTNDIDIVIELSPTQLTALIAKLPKEHFYVSPEAAMSAIENAREFNVIHAEGGVKIDFIIARQDAWGHEQWQRRRPRELLTGITAFTAAPEDVMLSKLLYYQEGGSEKHLRDIAGMFKWSADEIDVQYLEKWARELGVSAEWDAVRGRLSQS